ncbi:coagulation factor VIII-like isoform X2 [Asterias rubens]|uniref:coagulation factor VIII-like isoform X2 n=1 Tax=Asterias rubens TaxID=7604 RepID=UPI0014554CCC|nr:coagulation factor VIII-like isoform X2 [Asterias rubens]
MSPFLLLVLGVSVILELTESKMIVHHFGPPPDGYTTGQHWVTQVMKQVPKQKRCQSTQQVGPMKGKLRDCQALLDAGHKLDGIYTIYPYQNDTGIKVFCDMKSDTGWIVIQRRYDGSVNFKRSLADYKDGFGSMNGEFWLGNEILHKLTDVEGNWTIRVDLTNENNATGYVEEAPFDIKPDDYTLSFGYSSTQRTERWFCLQRLGMGDASIPDHSITASSTNGKVDGKCQPSNARLTQSANSNTIGWCPESYDNNPWLQIDLGMRVLVEGIMMLQGSDLGTSVDTSYEYSDDQRTWHNVDSKQIIRTTMSSSEATSMFHPPITARYIRIVLSQTDGSLWIRVELLGCKVHWVCAQPLGMEDLSIRSSQITASSYNQDKPISCKPSQGRLNHVNGGWCPSQVDKSSSWLQVDLLMATPIEGVITQGIDSNTLNWHVTSFQVEYSLNENTWDYTFRSNTDQSTPVTNKFEQPIRGRFIRIRPIRYSGYPAMRIELIGCRSGILQTANNRAFSIHHHTDVNQDETNCPGLNTEGGWWFNRCSGIPGVDNNLNAEYIQPGDTMGPYKRVIRASEWNGSRIAKTEIKIRHQSPPRG